MSRISTISITIGAFCSLLQTFRKEELWSVRGFGNHFAACVGYLGFALG